MVDSRIVTGDITQVKCQIMLQSAGRTAIPPRMCLVGVMRILLSTVRRIFLRLLMTIRVSKVHL